MRIRRRREADLDACLRLAEAVHDLDGYPRYLPGELRGFLVAVDAWAAWVAVDRSEVVGHVALHRGTSPLAIALASERTGWPPDRLAIVARLLVAPNQRRRGIGRALLDVSASHAIGLGLRPVLNVVTDDVSAIALYEACHWIRAGRVTSTFSDGTALDEFVYVPPPTGDPGDRLPTE